MVSGFAVAEMIITVGQWFCCFLVSALHWFLNEYPSTAFVTLALRRLVKERKKALFSWVNLDFGVIVARSFLFGK